VIQVDRTATGRNIRRLRRERGLTVQQTADQTQSLMRTVYKWEAGTSLPSLENLLELSDLFGVTVNELVVIEKGEFND